MIGFLTFYRFEQRRSNVRTSARIQLFCKKHSFNFGCYDGFRVCPRKTTERNRALYINKNPFCLIWKSEVESFNKTIKELKLNYKVVDHIICNKHVKNFIKLNINLKKFNLTQLTWLFLIWKLYH